MYLYSNITVGLLYAKTEQPRGSAWRLEHPALYALAAFRTVFLYL